jgi:hypothetical protein
MSQLVAVGQPAPHGAVLLDVRAVEGVDPAKTTYRPVNSRAVLALRHKDRTDARSAPGRFR